MEHQWCQRPGRDNVLEDSRGASQGSRGVGCQVSWEVKGHGHRRWTWYSDTHTAPETSTEHSGGALRTVGDTVLWAICIGMVSTVGGEEFEVTF